MKVDLINLDCEIKSNFDGRYISIRNKNKGFFDIFFIDNQNISKSLNPLSIFKKIYSGVAISLDWSSFNNDFACILLFGPNGKQINSKQNEEFIKKSGFLNTKKVSITKHVYDQKVDKMEFIIMRIYEDKVQAFQKFQGMNSPFRVFGGNQFGVCSKIEKTDLKNQNLTVLNQDVMNMNLSKAQFITYQNDKYIKQDDFIIEPQNLYQSENYLIAVYNNSFHLFENFEDSFQLKRIYEYQILNGYFFLNLFFFITDNKINLLLCQNNCIISIAERINYEKSQTFDNFQVLFPDAVYKPPGILKILMILDFNILLLDQNENVQLIQLEHPIFNFLISLQFQLISECVQIANKFNQQFHIFFAELLLLNDYKSEIFQLEGIQLQQTVKILLKANNLQKEELFKCLQQKFDQKYIAEIIKNLNNEQLQKKNQEININTQNNLNEYITLIDNDNENALIKQFEI